MANNDNDENLVDAEHDGSLYYEVNPGENSIIDHENVKETNDTNDRLKAAVNNLTVANFNNLCEPPNSINLNGEIKNQRFITDLVIVDSDSELVSK
jgi:hypothetical protein